jgi:serine/threonine protein kinase/tetratricopeptide (TPR) repeat protein
VSELDASRFARVRALFEQALDLPAEERADHVAAACGDDHDLEQQVLALLRGHERSNLDAPGSGALVAALHDAAEGGAAAAPPVELPDSLGPFRIERLLGAGGMGVVYEASQDHPKRRVALKVVSAAATGTRGRARFRDEIDVLARLSHPGIAAVLEAGEHAGNDGETQPWYAMELLTGARPLSTHVRAEELDWRAATGLLADAAEAVAHAHRVGVIHRDLKAANVLVDADGRVKVVDFGVARVVSGDGELPRHTQDGELVGTFGAMAPEQLEGRADTRSDVYALGVLLYEVLTGRAPHDLTGTPLSGLADALRASRPRPVREHDERVPPEIDWVLSTALAPEPDWRYDSAGDLARDLRRALAGEAVEAPAPSALSRLRVSLRRHRTPLTVSAVIVLLLAGGLWGTWLGLREAEDAREREELRRLQAESAAATAARVTDVLVELFTAPDPALDGHDVRVVDALRRVDRTLLASLGDEPAIESALRLALGRLHHNLGLYDDAARELARAAELVPLVAAAADHTTGDDPAANTTEDVRATERRRVDLDVQRGLTRAAQGRLDQAAAVLEPAVAWWRAGSDRPRLERARAFSALGLLRQRQDRLDEAVALDREAVAELDAVSGADHPYTWAARADLGAVLLAAQRVDEAAAELEPAVDGLLRHLGEDHPHTVRALNNLAGVRTVQDRLDEAADLLARAYAVRARILPEDHGELVGAQANLGTLHLRRGDVEQASALLQQAFVARRAAAPLPDADTLTMAANVLGLHLARGDGAAAGELLRDVLASGPGEHASSPRSAQVLENLARFLRDGGALPDAIAFAAEAVAVRERLQGDEHPDTLLARGQHALLHVGSWTPAQVIDELDGLWRLARIEPDGYATGALGSELGQALLAGGRLEDAEAPLLDAARILGEQGSRYEAALVWDACARLYDALGDAAEADAWRARLDGEG